MPYEIVENHVDCPEDRPVAVVNPETDEVMGCHPDRASAEEHMRMLMEHEDDDAEVETIDASAETIEVETIDAAADEPAMVQPWQGVLMVEGEPTSDGRVFTNITWRDLPLTLMWQRETSHGGVQTGGEFVVGRIDTITRDGNLILGSGVFDLGSDAHPNGEGREVVRLMGDQHLRGVSIEAAPADGTVEYDEENDRVLIDSAEIGAAAIVPFPAFREAYIELVGDATPAGAAAAEQVTPEAVTASTLPAPPAEWFDNPALTARTGLHVEDDGRIWGHLYGWGECHQGYANRCVQIPRGGSYRYVVGIDGRGVRCADGTFIQTGPVCITADHADTRGLTWLGAKDHYAHTGLAAADVVCGEDDHGIWVAGMVRPGTPPELVHALTASAPSGDWRLVGGRLELVAILMVNSPGYPAFASARSPHVVAAAFSGGEPTALIVQGQAPEHAAACSCGGKSGQTDEVLARMGALEALLGPVVTRIRAEQDVIVAKEMDALLAEIDSLTEFDDGMPRSLADIIAAGQST